MADAETRWLDLYRWTETEVLLLDRIASAPGTASGDALAIDAQAEELRHVRDHMRQADPALPVTEVDGP